MFSSTSFKSCISSISYPNFVTVSFIVFSFKIFSSYSIDNFSVDMVENYDFGKIVEALDDAGYDVLGYEVLD